MADRIIKGDSGNDVVIQNNGGTRKIEVTNSGDVEVTGDVKTTTVKATNLKANDGTAGLVVADSTGEVTSSGGLKTDTISEKTSSTGVTIDGTLIKDNAIKPASGQPLVLQEDGGSSVLTIDTSGNVTIAGGATIDGLTIGQGGGDQSTNTALGSSALASNTSGGNNTAVGRQALGAETTGINNTALGRQALAACNQGESNTACGYSALYDVTTGQNNIGIGLEAGRSSSPSGAITTGSNNVVLGNNSIANLYCADTTISSSDLRDKSDIEDFTHGLDWINQMRPVTYRWDRRSWYLGKDEEDINSVVKDGSKKRNKINLGLIAQEIMAIESADGYAQDRDSQLIANENEDGKSLGLKYDRLVPVIINAIKELSAKVEALENA